MCGICGIINFRRALNGEDEVILKKMNKKLIHRGPDAQDTVHFANVGLGFSRLSIIGLSNGMQPISNEDDTVVLICNGEIFNYIELRNELRKKGHEFATVSDVEVIVHLYEEYGMDFFDKLNGQFAFALYDKKKLTMFCARDQMGIIPFYYTIAGDNFLFASEIKAILQHPLVQREVDKVALDQVLTFAGLISPRTMFKDICSLENGHFIEVTDDGQIRDREYWDLVYPEKTIAMDDEPESYYINKLEHLFDESIRLRLRSDVPSGLYLSGGLDSSMIAMKVNQINPSCKKDAFSIDFAESQHSESWYQQLIASECNAELHQKMFLYNDITDRLQQAVYYSECPIKETYNTASLSLSESVRAKGIKVILSGEGADELFAGYVGYRFDKMRSMNGMQQRVDPKEALLRKEIWDDASFFYERSFTEYNDVKRKLYSDQINSSFEEINCLNYPLINKDRIRNRNVLNKRAYIDYKIRLVDHLVSDHGDRMAMANSVEVRYPFLDKDLINFSTRIPAFLKLNDFTEKYILKRIASCFVPDAILQREKFHFIAPGSPYLLKKNIEYIDDLLSYSQVKRQGFFNPEQIESLKKMYCRDDFTINAPFENDLLIVVITFGILQDHFFN